MTTDRRRQRSQLRKPTQWSRRSGPLQANLWRNFEATDRTAFGSVVLPASFGATSIEVGGGVVATVSQNVSLFATADYTTNLNGPHGMTIEGNLGVRVTW